MTPIQKALRLMGLGSDSVIVPREDLIGAIINNKVSNRPDWHPSQSQLRTHRGEASVVPYRIADVVYQFKVRKTGEPEIIHPANTEIRPHVWDLGYAHEPEEIPPIYFHDMGERGRLAENYAVVRLIADPNVFGQRYEWVMNALTNFRGTLHGQLEERLADPQDVIRSLHGLRSQVGLPAHQRDAYNEFTQNIYSYLGLANSDENPFNWEKEDIIKDNQLIQKFRDRVEALKSDTLPARLIRKRSNLFFEDIIRYARDPASLVLGPNCRLDEESPLIHNLDHFQYSGSLTGLFDTNWKFRGEGQIGGSYLEDLLIHSITRLKAGDPLAYTPVKTKIEENTDNLRKLPNLNPNSQHTNYTKGMAVSQIGDIFLRYMTDLQHPKVSVVYLALRYQKSELLRRVITDYNQTETQSDTDPKTNLPWLINQFKQIRGYVGREVEEYLLIQLERERKSLNQSTVTSAEKLLTTHKELTEIVRGMDGNGGERRRKSWSFGFL